MAPTQDNTSSQGLLDQQRVLAAFGEIALGAEDLSALLTEACRLVGQALKTDLAKVVELTPEGAGTRIRLTGIGYAAGAPGDALLGMFREANRMTLEQLRARFVTGPIDWAARQRATPAR